MTMVAELYGLPTFQDADWANVAAAQQCPYLKRKCLKNRKSESHLTIGTCTMTYGRDDHPIMICPFRLLERSQIFIDCIHLLTLHEPGNELELFQSYLYRAAVSITAWSRCERESLSISRESNFRRSIRRALFGRSGSDSCDRTESE